MLRKFEEHIKGSILAKLFLKVVVVGNLYSCFMLKIHGHFIEDLMRGICIVTKGLPGLNSVCAGISNRADSSCNCMARVGTFDRALMYISFA